MPTGRLRTTTPVMIGTGLSTSTSTGSPSPESVRGTHSLSIDRIKRIYSIVHSPEHVQLIQSWDAFLMRHTVEARLKTYAAGKNILPRKRAINPPLGLATLAALTPSHWHVSIVDENVESIPLAPQADIVGVCGTGVQSNGRKS